MQGFVATTCGCLGRACRFCIPDSRGQPMSCHVPKGQSSAQLGVAVPRACLSCLARTGRMKVIAARSFPGTRRAMVWSSCGAKIAVFSCWKRGPSYTNRSRAAGPHEMGLAGDGARGSIVHDFGLSISNFEGWNNLTHLQPANPELLPCCPKNPKEQLRR